MRGVLKGVEEILCPTLWQQKYLFNVLHNAGTIISSKKNSCVPFFYSEGSIFVFCRNKITIFRTDVNSNKIQNVLGSIPILIGIRSAITRRLLALQQDKAINSK